MRTQLLAPLQALFEGAEVGQEFIPSQLNLYNHVVGVGVGMDDLLASQSSSITTTTTTTTKILLFRTFSGTTLQLETQLLSTFQFQTVQTSLLKLLL